MSGFDGRKTNEDLTPTIQGFEGVGELAVGGLVAGGDMNRLIFTALSLLNDPVVNSYLLANKVKMQDRVTNTRIFPRDGMPLPNGEVFSTPQEEEVVLSETQENQ